MRPDDEQHKPWTVVATEIEVVSLSDCSVLSCKEMKNTPRISRLVKC